MAYAVKEIFHTLQGEGAQAGRAAVFCRFAGCNLWSGREEDRAAAACRFCDTDFVGMDGEGGGRFADADALAAAVARAWAGGPEGRYVVFTGGEPLLQLDPALIAAVHAHGFSIAIETNGTLPAPAGIDWICVSPKGANPLRQTSGDELKLVYPQADADPADFVGLAFRHRFLQPMDGPGGAESLRAAIRYCRADARWRLSLQTHKMIGIPQAMADGIRQAANGIPRATGAAYAILPSPVGALTLVAGPAGLRAVLWQDDDPARVPLAALGPRVEDPDHPVLRAARAELAAYFAGALRAFTVPLDFHGTAFQRAVWQALLTIPFGETRSYGAVARQIGAPGASRAVGAANGRNPISIIAPCHRVVGASGALTGFAGGLHAKETLLALEGWRPAPRPDAAQGSLF